MIVTVVLHGRLRKFGHKHRLPCSTPARAVHALAALQNGFGAALREGEYRVLRRPPGTKTAWALDEVGLHLRLPPAGELHIVPVGTGSGSGKSTGKAILGAVIVVAAVVAAIPSGGGSLALATPVLGGLTTAGAVAFFGATMFLAGVSGLLSPQTTTSTSSSSSAANDSSTSLGGAQNVAVQGAPVPLVYGRAMCGSVVVSIGYSAEDYATTAANTVASVAAAPPDDTVQDGTGSGGGGKGGGASSGARESPNTLRSKAVVRLIDVISEGPVGGLVNGAQGIYFNGTPLQAADGSFNFQGVTIVERTGQPDQDPVPGFPSAEQSIALSGVQIKQALPHIEYLNEATATAARVTIGIPALYSTDTSTGNLNPGPDLLVVVEVQAQRAGAPWVQVVSDLFTGQKCTSRYQRSYRFDLPERGQTGVTSWAVRVSRQSPDSTTASVASDLYWDAVDIITDHQLMYPNTHYVALTFDSEAFGTTLPTRAYLTDGLQIRVPENFDPDGRTYATSGAGTAGGTWDGVSWRLATTNDPGWCLLDVLTESRYGIGLPDSALETAIFDLFTVSQYAAGVIPDGFGGTEHRYSLNVQITDQDDAYSMLQQFVSAFRGMSYWSAGSMAVTADMPLTPAKLVVPGNVIDGTFRYEGTSLKTRHNVARVTWIDPSQTYRKAIEVVEDYDAIASQGQRDVDVTGFGVTSRGLARRLGRWLLDSEKHQTQTVSYSASLDHMNLRPGEIFQVADPNYAGARLGGRLVSATASSLVLDAGLPVDATQTHSISVTLPDATVETRVIYHYAQAADGSITTVVPITPFSAAPLAGAVYLVTSVDLDAPQFKVVRIVETDRGIFEVTGLEHDPGKFDRVEYDLPFRPHTFSLLPALLAQPIPPPSNPTARDYLAGVGTTTIVRVTVSWTPAVSPMIRGTQVRASGPEQRLVNADGPTVDIDGLPYGTYIFSVRHTGENGRVSAWVETDPVLVDGQSDAPPAITGLTAVGGTRRVSLKWNASNIRDLLHYEVWRSNVASLASAGRLTYVDATTYADSDQDVLQPNTTWYYWVRAVSTTLALGAWSNMAQATTSYLLTDDLEQAIRDTAKYAQGLLNSIGQPTTVASLPASGVNGQIVFNTQDAKLYQWSSAQGAWVLYIPTVGATIGNLTADQITSINAAVIQGTISSDQIASLAAAKVAGQLTDAQVAALSANKLTGSLTPAQVGSLIPAGTLTSDQIVSLTAAKVAGQLSSAQIASLDANKLTGTLTQANVTALIPSGTLSSDQVASLQAAKVTGQIGSTQISDGAILTPKLAAGSVVAATIAASAITVDKLSVGGGQNVIWNGCLEAVSDGWAFSGDNAALDVFGPSITNGNAGWVPPGSGSGVMAYTAGNFGTGQYASAFWSPNGGVYQNGGISVIGGHRYEWQASVITHRISCYLQIAFYDINNNPISAANSSEYCALYPVVNLNDPKNFVPIGLFATAPTNAVKAVPILRMIRDPLTDAVYGSSAGVTPIVFWTRALFSEVPANAQQLQPWTPGGMTQFSGGMIATNSIRAQSILAGSITSAQIQAGSIAADRLVANSITAGQLAANSVTTAALSAGSVVAATIAASAITVDKLSVGGGQNVIWNGCLEAVSDGWAFSGDNAALDVFGPSITNGNAGWVPPGSGSGVMAYTAGNFGTGQYASAFWSPNGGVYQNGGISVIGGHRYEWQASVITHRISCYLQIAFYDINNNPISAANSSEYCALYPVVNLNDPKNFVPIGLFATAPTNAVKAVPILRMIRDPLTDAVYGSSAGVTPIVFWTRALFSEVPANAQQLQPWTPGGMTQFSGGMIATNSIRAQSILAGSITSAQIQAGSIAADRLVANSITAGQLAANSVTTAALSAGSVVAATIAASAITADKLAISSSNNVIGNSCFEVTMDGWTGTTPGGYFGLAGPANADWSLRGSGTGCFSCSAGNPYCLIDWSPTTGVAGVPMPQHQRIQAAGLVAHTGAAAQIILYYYDASGALLGQTASASLAGNWSNYGLVDANYTRITLLDTTPANTSTVLMRVACYPTAGQSATALVTKAMLGIAPPNATQAGDWTPGGITSITGGMIKANSIDASRIVAGSITALQIAAGTITAEKIAAGSITSYQIAAHSITADNIAANTITAGQIQAGAIAADQIAANAIYGRHMAAEEIISLSAQIGYGVITSAHIGDATIQTANIGDLTVNGQKISVNAVSEIAFANTSGNSPSSGVSLIAGVTVQPGGYTNNRVQILWRTMTPALSSGGTGAGGGNDSA